MLSIESETLDDIFMALGSPVRRRILQYLGENGEATVTDIATPFDVSLNAISKHMKVLEKAGLIQREIRGREHYCRLNSQSLMDAAEWLNYYQQFWTTRLDALEQHLLNLPRSEKV